MGTKLRDLRPAQVFEDCLCRSVASGVAGFLVFGSLQAGSPPLLPHRPSFVVASGITAVFLATFALLLAYYHKRLKLGICVATILFLLPWAVNLAWAMLFSLSLFYPTIGLAAIGPIAMDLVHRKISGPQPEDDVEEELLRRMMGDMDPNLTWMDTALRLCFLAGAILLLILLVR